MLIDWEAKHRRLAEIVETHSKLLQHFCDGTFEKCDVILVIKHFKEDVDRHLSNIQEDMEEIISPD